MWRRREEEFFFLREQRERKRGESKPVVGSVKLVSPIGQPSLCSRTTEDLDDDLETLADAGTERFAIG